jgi:hypothetical protein
LLVLYVCSIWCGTQFLGFCTWLLCSSFHFSFLLVVGLKWLFNHYTFYVSACPPLPPPIYDMLTSGNLSLAPAFSPFLLPLAQKPALPSYTVSLTPL